jgi:hypothetical protein
MNSKYLRISFSIGLLLLVLIGHVLVKPAPGVIDINPKLLSDDGIWYSAKSLEFMGTEKQESYDKTIEWWNEFRSDETPEYMDFAVPIDTILIDSFFGSRVIYPLLSTPFVKLFGFYGLLIVPILAFSLIWLLLISTIFNKSTISFYVSLILLAGSTHYTKALVSTAGTDSLLCLLIFCFFYYSTKLDHKPTIQILILNFIVFLGSFTKQSVSIWLIFSFIYLLILHHRRLLNNILILTFFITLVFNSLFCFFISEKLWGSVSAAEKMNWYPDNFSFNEIVSRTFHLWFNEIVTILTKDFNLLFILLLSALYVCKLLLGSRSYHHSDSILLSNENVIVLFTLGLLGAVILNVTIIGLPNQGLRLQAPLIPFFTCLAAKQLQILSKSAMICKHRA